MIYGLVMIRICGSFAWSHVLSADTKTCLCGLFFEMKSGGSFWLLNRRGKN